MTTMFNWNESFLVGISMVDIEHKRLVELINDVGEAAMSKDHFDPEKLKESAMSILEYTRIHFRDEEAMMKSAGLFPAYIKYHQNLHKDFVEEAKSLASRAESLSPHEAEQMLGYLVEWLAYHILGVDQGMARQVRAVQDGQDAEQAYQTDADQTQTGTEPLLTALKGLFKTVSQRNLELRQLNNNLEQLVEQRTAELKQANRQLEALAVHDELTGLPNRRFAISLLDNLWTEACDQGFNFSVLLLDADKFKQVNDTHGHAVGDDLLRSLAKSLQEAVRNDDTVCRLGGDEFLVICPQCPQEDAALVAEKILTADKKYCNDQGMVIWEGPVSIGFAQARSSMARPEDLLEAADQALYAAKRQGGCRAMGT
ncbi:GGDEF domain-containing protein [Desulfonatronovibrio magnus]|uniref:GGDEF domain-containing protein n=1 Tax=Desulfonatronovibrio magnus TaxID=698827 RepID=UPI000A05D1B3|nr:GGDEF domain-containing protein [Desulfonatronovibrio magnus]